MHLQKIPLFFRELFLSFCRIFFVVIIVIIPLSTQFFIFLLFLNGAIMDSKQSYQKAYKSQYNKRHKNVNVGLTLAEYKQLCDASAIQNKKPTTMLRDLAFAQLNETNLQPAEVIQKLNEHNLLIRNIANNLNQIAHHANIFSEVDKQQVFTHLQQLHEQVADFITQQD